jgi:hypothetical protein
MLGVFYYAPGTHELAPLKRNKIPYVIISPIEPPDDDDDDVDPPTDDSDDLRTVLLTATTKLIDILEDLEDELELL